MDKSVVYISVIIPVFNESECLGELYRRLNSTMQSMNCGYEIIFVDDGSTDKSPEILNGFRSADKAVTVVSFCRNFGQHAAVMAGFKNGRGNIIVTLDADLQNPPEEIPKLINKIEEGFDVVAGRRAQRRDSLSRRAVSKVMNILISKLTGVKLSDYGCMLRAYRKRIIEILIEYGEKSVYIPAFTSWICSNIVEIPVAHHPRAHGKSRYSFLKFSRQAFDLITAYTVFPIQLIGIIGAIFSIVGFLLACYLISFRLFFGTPNPLTTFISALLFFSGITILFIGIISEYIARIYIETRKRPLYILKEEIAKGEK